MGDGRPGFVLCICARRGPCALDTTPSAGDQAIQFIGLVGDFSDWLVIEHHVFISQVK
jgi:hypothetical protein